MLLVREVVVAEAATARPSDVIYTWINFGVTISVISGVHLRFVRLSE